MTDILAIFRDQLPATPWKWRSAQCNGGGSLLPSEMSTRHLFYTLRMIWNHTMPEHMRVGFNARRYSSFPGYAQEYMAEAIRRIGGELSTRTDLAPFQKRELEQMATHLRGLNPKLESRA